jgi:hypothetical protein
MRGLQKSNLKIIMCILKLSGIVKASTYQFGFDFLIPVMACVHLERTG